MGFWEYGNMGIWEYGKSGVLEIREFWRFEKKEIYKGQKFKTSFNILYSSVSYIDHPYFCPHCFDFIHQGLREADLILEEDTF